MTTVSNSTLLPAFIALATFLIAYRLVSVLPNAKNNSNRPQKGKSTHTVAIFLGSGGHTSEALTLISALDPERFNRIIYVVSSGDNLSIQKAVDFEVSRTQNPNYSVLSIPRARRVHQSLITTPVSATLSLLFCTYHLTLRPLFIPTRPIFADVLILNGPGTCFVLCIAVYISKFFGLPAPRIIYVETFARVKSLSLSGKLIRPFADRFITQWPRLRNSQEQLTMLNCDNWLV